MKARWIARPGLCTCDLCGQRARSSWFYQVEGGVLACRACFVATTRQRPPALLDGMGWRFAGRVPSQNPRHNRLARESR